MSLIEKLEKAKEGSLELDIDIAVFIGDFEIREGDQLWDMRYERHYLVGNGTSVLVQKSYGYDCRPEPHASACEALRDSIGAKHHRAVARAQASGSGSPPHRGVFPPRRR